jgi:hypothetical protein
VLLLPLTVCRVLCGIAQLDRVRLLDLIRKQLEHPEAVLLLLAHLLRGLGSA